MKYLIIILVVIVLSIGIFAGSKVHYKPCGDQASCNYQFNNK